MCLCVCVPVPMKRITPFHLFFFFFFFFFFFCAHIYKIMLFAFGAGRQVLMVIFGFEGKRREGEREGE